MSRTQVPVLVVGAGLAGLSVATFLALHGVAPLLVERRKATTNQPKARGQFPHTMEALRVADVDAEFAAATPPGGFPIRIAASVTGPVFKEILGSDSWPDFRGLAAVGWADVSQERAELILLRRAHELGAHIRFGTELVSCTQDADGVTAELRDLATGETSSVRADYLVAADGHTSPIRAALGIGVHGRGTATGTIFDADLGELINTGGALYYLRNPALPGGAGALVTTDTPGRYVLNVGLVDGAAPSPQRWVELIRIATGLPDVAPTLAITHERTFVTKHQVADRFTEGRVHLIGDAARVMPPTGGAGGNTAVLDGFHLAWKLAMVVRGEAGPGLLASHDPERRPYSDILADQQYAAYISRMAPHRADGTEAAPASPVSALYFGYRHLSEAVAIEPDDDGALLENPERPTGRPGTRAPHVRLRDNGTELSTRDLFGRHFVLLAGAAGSDWLAAAEKAERALGIRCAGFLIGGATGAVDLDETFGARYGISPTGAVLVRPDGFIAWRAMADGSPAELETALRRILHRNGDLADGGR